MSDFLGAGGVFICGGWGRRIEDAGRRRWQRRALRASKNLFSYRHREASQMPWRSEQEQQPGGLIETKIFCFIQIATLIAFAMNDE
ncbi:MAG: hypothetical protein K2L04_03980 [Alistipes sp.]|nr:hypothetical protein [Alistipes sp.]